MNPNCSPRSSVSDSLIQRDLSDSYTILKDLGRGTYGKVVLANCKETGTNVALKILPKSSTKLRDFIREFNFSYYLSPHKNIINTFDVAFESPTSYVFAQEHAPMGDLFEAISPQQGISERAAKNLMRQLVSCLEFMHSKNLVHRDVKPENILIFDDELRKIKLMDFGMTRKVNTMVKKVSSGIPYTPPEICESLKGERYVVETAADVWAAGVLLFCALTGNFPWENAHHTDIFFNEFVVWQRRKTTRIPSQWRTFTPRMLRLFRRLLEMKPERRCSIKEVYKYLRDAWVVQNRSSSEERETQNSTGETTDDLSTILENHGIETKINKSSRERRIFEWLLST